jgi:acyl-CoA thioester hydrolase
MPRSPFQNETRVRVRYAETDQMGVVYYANYYVWMELGRVEFVRALGVNYKEMEATDGLLLAVVESNCRYLRPAKYDQEISIVTTVNDFSHRGIEFTYQMNDVETGEILAVGTTKHMWLNREFRPTRLPEKYMDMLAGKVNA